MEKNRALDQVCFKIIDTYLEKFAILFLKCLRFTHDGMKP